MFHKKYIYFVSFFNILNLFLLNRLNAHYCSGLYGKVYLWQNMVIIYGKNNSNNNNNNNNNNNRHYKLQP